MVPENLQLNDALHEACRQGQVDQVETLLETGANPDCVIDGQTALHVAMKHKKPKCVAKLVQYGADIDIPNSDGYSPRQLGLQRAKLLI